MIRKAYDCIVVGGHGAFGSQSVYHMARQGAKVLSIDMLPVGHSQGSSHGQTRITRLAYAEGAAYVPLLRRSLELFIELSQRSSVELYKRTGMLDIGSTFESALFSAREHKLEHSILSAEEVNSRFPGFSVPDGMKALYQPDGGILRPEKIIEATCSLSKADPGVEFLQDKVVSFTDLGSSRGVEVRTAGGSTYRSSKLLIASGPWIRQLLPQLSSVCLPVRQVVGWFDLSQEDEVKFDPLNFPVFIIGPSSEQLYYGFPQYGETRGLKIGLYNHLHQAVPDPDEMDRVTRPEDEAALREGVKTYFPLANRPMVASNTCLFTNTPDSNFIIDFLPTMSNVMVCSSCSGHGFKLSSGVGELVAKLILDPEQIEHHQDYKAFLAMHKLDRNRKGFEKAFD